MFTSCVSERSLSQNTYTNADKLLEAAEQLAQTGECDPEEIYQAAHQLEDRIQDFVRRVEQRKILLDMSVSFHTHVKEVSFHGTKTEPCPEGPWGSMGGTRVVVMSGSGPEVAREDGSLVSGGGRDPAGPAGLPLSHGHTRAISRGGACQEQTCEGGGGLGSCGSGGEQGKQGLEETLGDSRARPL